MKHLYKPFFIILLTLAAALCIGMGALAAEGEAAAVEEAAPSDAFEDLSYSENETALRYMIDGGYIAGYTDGTFRPGRSYTRLELAQLVTALCELETAAGYESSFYDCAVAGADAIDAAVSNGLMTGRTSQSFDPYGTVLKAEMLGTLEKAAEYLQLEGFYDHASGDYTDWTADYTICTADEAMQSAYQLAQALALRAEAEQKAAEVEAAANAVAQLTAAEASDEPAASDEMTASGEISASEEPTADAADETASAEPAASGEPAEEDAAAEETAAAQADTGETSSTPPAGVSTPATESTAAAQPTQTAQSEPVSASASAPAASQYDESDALRNAVKDKYSDIRSSIVDFLLDLLG